MLARSHERCSCTPSAGREQARVRARGCGRRPGTRLLTLRTRSTRLMRPDSSATKMLMVFLCPPAAAHTCHRIRPRRDPHRRPPPPPRRLRLRRRGPARARAALARAARARAARQRPPPRPAAARARGRGARPRRLRAIAPGWRAWGVCVRGKARGERGEGPGARHRTHARRTVPRAVRGSPAGRGQTAAAGNLAPAPPPRGTGPSTWVVIHNNFA